MTDLEFDLDNIDEDTMRDWNRGLNKLTDEILAGDAKTNHSRTGKIGHPGNEQKD